MGISNCTIPSDFCSQLQSCLTGNRSATAATVSSGSSTTASRVSAGQNSGSLLQSVNSGSTNVSIGNCDGVAGAIMRAVAQMVHQVVDIVLNSFFGCEGTSGSTTNPVSGATTTGTTNCCTNAATSGSQSSSQSSSSCGLLSGLNLSDIFGSGSSLLGSLGESIFGETENKNTTQSCGQESKTEGSWLSNALGGVVDWFSGAKDSVLGTLSSAWSGISGFFA